MQSCEAHTPALILPVLLVLAPQTEARDRDEVLRGVYAYTFTRVCAQSAAGFNASLQPLGPVQQLTSTIEMVQTYNADGTSSATAHALNIINNATAQNELDFTCSGTYLVNDDRSFSEEMTCSGSIVAGALVGQTFTQTGVRRTGRIGHGARTLVISDTRPDLENITFSGFGSNARMCGRSGTGVKIR